MRPKEIADAWIEALGEGWEGVVSVGEPIITFTHRDGVWFRGTYEFLAMKEPGLVGKVAEAVQQAVSEGRVGELEILIIQAGVTTVTVLPGGEA